MTCILELTLVFQNWTWDFVISELDWDFGIRPVISKSDLRFGNWIWDFGIEPQNQTWDLGTDLHFGIVHVISGFRDFRIELGILELILEICEFWDFGIEPWNQTCDSLTWILELGPEF